MFEKSYAAAEYITDTNIKRQLFRSILAKFGGNFYGFMTGGAPLDPSVGEFFERIGIKIYQGYGLSETSPVISFDHGEDRKLLSVGPVLDTFEASDSYFMSFANNNPYGHPSLRVLAEVIVRGGNVYQITGNRDSAYIQVFYQHT